MGTGRKGAGDRVPPRHRSRLRSIVFVFLDGWAAGRGIPVAACLNIAGRPKSATRQAAPLTGRNVPEEEEHYDPKPNTGVHRALDRDIVFSTLVGAGVSMASANTYPPDCFSGIQSGRRLPSTIPYALTTVGLPLPSVEAHTAKQAISGTITDRDWHRNAALRSAPVHEADTAVCRVGLRFRHGKEWRTCAFHAATMQRKVAHPTDTPVG